MEDTNNPDDEFSFSLGKEKEVSKSLEKVIERKIAGGLNPGLVAVARLLSGHEPKVRRSYMLNLSSPNGGRMATEEEVDRAISKADGTLLNESGGKKTVTCKETGKKSKSMWPNPASYKADEVISVHESLDVSSSGGMSALTSPDEVGHTVAEFLEHAYHGVDKPIYLGDRYSGEIINVSDVVEKAEANPKWVYCLSNPMRRMLTDEEVSSGDYKSGGRCNKLSCKALEVVTIESDCLNFEQQSNLIAFLSVYLPLCYVVSSGKKSLHATFSLKGLLKKQVMQVREVLSALGADPSVLKPCQLTRMGGAIRPDTGKKQKVLYMDCKARHREVDKALLNELLYMVEGATKGRDIVDSLLMSGADLVYGISESKLYTADLDNCAMDSHEFTEDYSIPEEPCIDEGREQEVYPSVKSTSDPVLVEPRDRRVIIEGLMRVGHKGIISAPSKAGKTWLLINLALMVEAGREWLGFKCRKTPVLFINFELLEDEFIQRVQLVQKTLGLEHVHFDVLTLRDVPVSWEILTGYLTDHCERAERTYGLIILDPIYKMLGDTDENSNGQVGLMLAALGRLAKKTRTGVIFSHHHSKGSKASVHPLDRMSGAGTFARDPDVLIDLVEHEQENCFTVEAVPRAFAKPTSRVVRKDFPSFELMRHLDPALLKKPGGSKQLYDVNHVARAFGGREKMSNAELIEALIHSTGMGVTTAKKLIKEAEDKGYITTDNKKKGKSHDWTLR